MEYRRFGRIGHRTSVLVYGAASLWEADSPTAAASLDQALAAGINSLDTAQSYGEAERAMGPSIPAIRDDVFLATKTGDRTADGAWQHLVESLELLQTDHIDLWQIHACMTMDELDKAFASGGVIEAMQRARDEGIVDWIGITGHTEFAPVVHLEALQRFDFDAVLTPMNYHLWQDLEYRERFTALLEELERRDIGLRTIKATAHRPYLEGEQRYNTWYRPFDEQQRITAAISWVLAQFPQIAGLPTAGELSLLGAAITAEAQRMTLDEAEAVLAKVDDYASPFSVEAR